ncbi:COMM domain-containing protein 5 [Bicyclus anynana]|uniref:COMM domain-containing protein 5 n=1 Tax=Bicyclus anynana TaxID=110368 RepID=A0A6J1NQN2_BICAN|nr:COMM domain-containing protein 5 [Bicyclus anynana]
MSQQLELLTESASQWNAVAFVTPEIQKKEIKPFVLLALKELEGNPDSRTSSLLNGDKFSAVRSVVRHVARLRSASKEPWGEDDMRLFLEGLRFSPDCASELMALLCTDQIYNNLQKHLRVKPGLLSLQWKIDVSLSQSTIQSENADKARSKEIMHRDTLVILTLTLTNGQTNIYRLSILKFHELRYVIASALKSMIVLKRKCMRKD